jgi:1-acyl-sn-glycerol-3-phosphate acyltransferase
VNPRNFYRLLQTGQAALLFPGGVREALHGKNEDYQVFWPEKTDFVRVAARFNATIVPLAAIGAADSVNILLDAPELLQLPFGVGGKQNVMNYELLTFLIDLPLLSCVPYPCYREFGQF